MVCLIAFAVVGSRSVVTVLTAFTFDLRALVNVLTGFAILHESVAFIALTVKAGQGVDAFVLTLIQFDLCTLVHMTVSRLIRHVVTIDLLVAHTLVRNALSTLAPEL